MEIIYELNIVSIDCLLEKDNLNNIIKSINWSLTGRTLESEYSIGGTQALPSPDEDNFIGLEDINEEILKEWLTGLIELNNYKSLIEDELNRQNINSEIIITIPIEQLN